MAGCNPRDEWQHDREDDKHYDRARCLKIFVAQQYGEGAAIKKETGDQNEVPGGSLRAGSNLHLLLDATQGPGGFKERVTFCFLPVDISCGESVDGIVRGQFLTFVERRCASS